MGGTGHNNLIVIILRRKIENKRFENWNLQPRRDKTILKQSHPSCSLHSMLPCIQYSLEKVSFKQINICVDGKKLGI